MQVPFLRVALVASVCASPVDHGNASSAKASRASKRDNGSGLHDKASKASRQAFNSSCNQNRPIVQISKCGQIISRKIALASEDEQVELPVIRNVGRAWVKIFNCRNKRTMELDPIWDKQAQKKIERQLYRKGKKYWQLGRREDRDAKYSYTQYALNDPNMDVVFFRSSRDDEQPLFETDEFPPVCEWESCCCWPEEDVWSSSSESELELDRFFDEDECYDISDFIPKDGPKVQSKANFPKLNMNSSCWSRAESEESDDERLLSENYYGSEDDFNLDLP